LSGGGAPARAGAPLRGVVDGVPESVGVGVEVFPVRIIQLCCADLAGD
jgi:hypothetical protein